MHRPYSRSPFAAPLLLVPLLLPLAAIADEASAEGVVPGSAVAGESLAADDPPSCGARLDAVFVESAPRDRFELAHRSVPGWTVGRVALDLADSAGRLVFDTEAGGRGVEVFQPFRAEAGAVRVRDARTPADGESRLALEFGRSGAGAFVAGETFVFSIDVDDRLDASELGQIRVSGGEIAGARLSVDLAHERGVVEKLVGYFGEDARVELVGTRCPG